MGKGQLRGIISAVSTPMLADGSIDDAMLRTLVDRTIDGGIHGLIPCGSTGEFFSMTNAERRHTAEVVISQAAGRVPVMPNVGANGTREVIELAKHAQSNGASGVLCVSPFYEPLSMDEIRGHFLEISDAIEIPIILYNLPSATGVNLTGQWLADLAKESANVRYVKDTTGDLSQAARMIHEHADVISTFQGLDTLVLACFLEGGAGAILGSGNLIPERLVELWNLVQAGDHAKATARWLEIEPLMRFLCSVSYTPAVKAGVSILGLTAGSPRKPVTPIPAEQHEKLTSLLRALEPARVAG